MICNSSDDTLALGEDLAGRLIAGDIVLLYGGLGAGKTLFTKGVLSGLEFDIDEVTSPSFTLVNLYKTNNFDVYHIDLWRLDGAVDAAAAVGLREILEDDRAVTIIEWADRVGEVAFENNVIEVRIEGDGDEPRRIEINRRKLAKKG